MQKNRQERRAKLNHYLDHSVKPIFDRLITELLAAMPDDIITWSCNWLQDKGRRLSTNQYSSGEEKTKEQHHHHHHQHINHHSGSEDEEDDADELPQPVVKKGNRTGVSAEVYGNYNKKEDFVPRVIVKSEDQVARIVDKLSKSFMFTALDEKEQKIVVDAMEEKSYQSGDYVIKQGEDGDELYVIDQGALDCYKVFKKDAEPTYLKTYQPGESFGELALLYNAPRAASIKAKTPSVCFALDRATFNNIVKDAAVKKREKFEQILAGIDLLKDMDPYERTHLGDGAKEVKYKTGETVIKQGDPGDKFYMISDGELVATRVDGGKSEQVFHYKAGDYFGELALLKNVPRQATVTAKTDVTLVFLDFESFKRLMGPIEDILKRNMDRYKEYIK